MFNQCDDLAHSPADYGNATFALVLLLAACLLVILSNRFAGGAVVYEFEQSKCISPSAVVKAKRAGAEDVPLSQVVSLLC